MLFRGLSNNPKTLICVGMVCLTVSLMLPYFAHPVAPLALNSLHFVRGLLVGISAVFNLRAARQWSHRPASAR